MTGRPRTRQWAVTAGLVLAVTAATLTACSRPHQPPGPDHVTMPSAAAVSPNPENSLNGEDADDGAQPDVSAPADPAALDVISAFATAWARPGLDQPHWYADVARYATPAYAALLGTVDPAMVPATQITAAPTVRTATASSVVADVGTDAGPITITCDRYDSRWLVVDVKPPEHPSVAATP